MNERLCNMNQNMSHSRLRLATSRFVSSNIPPCYSSAGKGQGRRHRAPLQVPEPRFTEDLVGVRLQTEYTAAVGDISKSVVIRHENRHAAAQQRGPARQFLAFNP